MSVLTVLIISCCVLVCNCRAPSKPMTVSQKARTTTTSSSDGTSDTDEGSDGSNTSDDDDEGVNVGVDLSPPTLDKSADDTPQQVAFVSV